MKRTPLQRGTPLRRTTPPAQRTHMRPVSRKRERENRERDRNIPQPNGQRCTARLSMCTGRAVDRHELLSRARGGSITDPSNVTYLCRACHRYITEHPSEAERLGWARSQHGNTRSA